MKKINLLSLVALFAALILTTGCSKDDDHNHDDHNNENKGQLEVAFSYVWGMSATPFSLNTELTHPRTGEKLTFTTFKFFISNIQLKDAEGNWWVQPESYHLVDATSTSRSTFTIDNVPAKQYVEMKYTVGVDSTRNVSGAQTGALATTTGMFWSWNTGYIMIKAEGSEETHGNFSYHLGGFSGENSIVTEKITDFDGTPISIANNNKTTINMVANPARLWHTVDGVEERSTVHMPGANAKILADDFIFTVNFKN